MNSEISREVGVRGRLWTYYSWNASNSNLSFNCIPPFRIFGLLVFTIIQSLYRQIPNVHGWEFGFWGREQGISHLTKRKREQEPTSSVMKRSQR